MYDEYDETIYVVDADENIIDAYKNIDNYNENSWLAEKVIEWFKSNRDAKNEFCGFTGIDTRWMED